VLIRSSTAAQFHHDGREKRWWRLFSLIAIANSKVEGRHRELRQVSSKDTAIETG